LLLDHHGAVDTDELFLKLRAMVKGSGCEVLIIDPLQAAVTSNSNETIDDFMDRLLKLAKETQVSVIVVSHMRKPSMTNPHNVNEYDLKGSGSINQIAFNTILLSRDKMAEDDYARNSTMIQVVKCRRTGLTGPAGWLYYNSTTGRLERGEAPDVHTANTVEEF
jgi:twinkle protein